MGRRKVDLDTLISDHEAREARERGLAMVGAGNRELIGIVEHFYDNLSVAAIKLSGELGVGDVIEIGSADEAVRQRVQSIQINRRDVSKASAGDSVGILLKWRVGAGSNVYRLR